MLSRERGSNLIQRSGVRTRFGDFLIFSGERGGIVAGLSVVILLIGVAGCFIFYFLGKIVPPNMIGVRQNFFGEVLGYNFVEEGYLARGLSPGLHLNIPFISEVILLPRGFLFVNFNDQPQGGDLDLSVLDVPTKDGSKVKTDLTLIVRLFERASKDKLIRGLVSRSKAAENEVPFSAYEITGHGGPKDFLLNYKEEQKKQLQTFASTAKNFLRGSLGELSTTDYYEPTVREREALLAQDEINKDVNKYGIELWANLIRRYVYAEKNIDDQIFAKNLQEATERLNSSASKLAGAKAETEKTRALWDAKIKDLEVDGDAKVRVIRSEGDLYEAEKMAEGDLLVAKAKAEVDAAKAAALNTVEGSEVYIAREMAPLLRTLSGGIVSGIDPFDIGAWMKKLIGKAAVKPVKKTASPTEGLLLERTTR